MRKCMCDGTGWDIVWLYFRAAVWLLSAALRNLAKVLSWSISKAVVRHG